LSHRSAENKDARAFVPVTPTGGRLLEMFDRLLAHFGPQEWWPAETPLEVMIGAILTQNTNWGNVEKAIRNLKERGLISIDPLVSMPTEDLADIIRPAGYYNIKARRLKNLLQFIHERYEGDLNRLFEQGPQVIREALLTVNGVGQETADSIVLYAANQPIFVVDAYTYRILTRHRMAPEDATYEDIQSLFMDHLPEDVSLYNEFHALVVLAGKTYCRKTPLCSGCPLDPWETHPCMDR